jgi:hypothetical protein
MEAQRAMGVVGELKRTGEIQDRSSLQTGVFSVWTYKRLYINGAMEDFVAMNDIQS